MPNYLFRLGREHTLSLFEIKAVLQHLNIKYELVCSDKDYLEIITKTLDAKLLLSRFGGVVYIAKLISPLQNNIFEIVKKYLVKNKIKNKISFSLEGRITPKINLEIKRELKHEGHLARYVEIKNTASIIHNNLIESKSHLTIFNNKLFYTEAVQDIQEYTNKDLNRPALDAKSGMLPPKLAKTMINLAGAPKDAVILDPFCGSGTVLLEALDLGFTNIIGSDLSEKAVNDSKQNVAWFFKNNPTKPQDKVKIFLSDASKINEVLVAQKIDVVVTEPFMGKPLLGHESKGVLKKQAEDLSNLYIKTLTALKKCLNPGGLIIFIFPSFFNNHEEIRTFPKEKIIELGLEIIPFDEKNEYLSYRRLDQHVKRNIYKLR